MYMSCELSLLLLAFGFIGVIRLRVRNYTGLSKMQEHTMVIIKIQKPVDSYF